MATITEDYVSLETAKLLKDKGFNEPCLSHFWSEENGNDIEYTDRPFTYKQLYNGDVLRPTLQMAMKWLREEKGIAVVPILSSVLDNERFLWDIEITVAKANENYHQGLIYESYERACEAAVKYCLENLI